MRPAVLALLFLFATSTVHADDDTESRLPLPRFAALGSSEINVRSGPGTRYPILWVYRREALPVEIVDEFEHWRKIRDFEGTSGWVHKGMLDGRRTAMISAKQPVMLRDDPEDEATPTAKLKNGVVGRLLACKPDWCRLQVQGKKGWILKKQLFGAYAKETFEK